MSVSIAWVVGLALLRLVGLPPEACGNPSAIAAGVAVGEAAGWMGRALLPDGRFVYQFDKATGAAAADYNTVRHAAVVMSLYQLAASGDRSGLATADAGMAFMLDHLVRHGDRAVFAYQEGDPKLGSSALMLAGLAHRRLATGDPQYDGLMAELARGVLNLQRPNGGFWAYTNGSSGQPMLEQTSLYYTGEAFWALALMHRLFPDEGYDVAVRAVAGYIATERDDEEGYIHPPWADQWATYGFNEMVGWGETLAPEHIVYLRSLAARYGLMVRGESQRQSGGLAGLVRGGQARGGGFGTVAEGLGSLWRLSGSQSGLADLRGAIEERLTCAAGILIDRQYDAADAAAYPRPDLVRGAWFVGDETRMDDQQHVMSGIMLARPLLEERGEP